MWFELVCKNIILQGIIPQIFNFIQHFQFKPFTPPLLLSG